MDILDKIFGRSELSEGVAQTDVGALVSEASRLKKRKDKLLTPEEIESVAEEMDVDAAFLKQAFNQVQVVKRLKYLGYTFMSVLLAVSVVLIARSWWNRPVLTQGDSSLLESGLEDIHAGR